MTWRGSHAAQGISAGDDVCSAGASAAGIANLSASMAVVLMKLQAVEKKFTGPEHHTVAVTAEVPEGTSHSSLLLKLSSAVTPSEELPAGSCSGFMGIPNCQYQCSPRIKTCC
jgi:hypothetical protein